MSTGVEAFMAEALEESIGTAQDFPVFKQEEAPVNFAVGEMEVSQMTDPDCYHPDDSVDMLPSTFLTSFGEEKPKGKCSVCARKTSKLNCPTCFIKQSNWGYKRHLQRHFTREREVFLEKSVQVLEKIAPSTNAINSLANLEEEIRSLQRRIAVKKSIISEKRRKLKDTRERRAKSAQQIRNFQRSLETWPKYMYNKEEKLKKVQGRLNKGEEQLARIRGKLAEDAFIYIFPISPIADSGHEVSSTLQDALAEATLTNFVDGHWVFNCSNSSTFRILHSRITEGKDWEELQRYLFPLRENTAIPSSQPPSRVISSLAALLYATQLCELLSRVYNVKLPFHLNRPEIIDFAALAHDEFSRALLKLFMKIGFLCLSQAQGPNCIEFGRPFCNLFSLHKNLDKAGRERPYRAPTKFIQNFLNGASDLSWPSIEELGKGWEPDSEGDSSWDLITEDIPYLQSPTSQQPIHSITGLLTSASSSISNFFGRVDRGGI